MVNIKINTIIALAFLGVFSVSVYSAELEPLSEAEVYGGAGCIIANPKGKTLVEGDRIKIDGTLIELKKGAFTKNSKTWSGEGIEVVFSISKGKLLETKDGGFSPGKGAMGRLSFTHKGSKGEIKAQEKCSGD
jgi:hypothetical protein